MTYEVLRDFQDDDFKVLDGNGGKVPLSHAVGDKFIPAAVHYPKNKVDALVLNGSLRLIVKEAPVDVDEAV